MSISSPVPFTLAGIRRGMRLGSALSPPVLVYGIVFGVLAGEAGRSALEAVLMSALIHSGSAQIAALQGMAAGPYVAPIVATILLTNARYVLYGAALRPWYPGAPPAGIYPTLFLLGDGNWAMAMKEHAEGRHDAGFLLGSGLAQFFPWTIGTWIGHAAGSAVADPRRLGMDFMIVALAAAMATAFWRGRASLLPAGVALAVALGVHAIAPGGWVALLAGLAGAAAAWAAHDGQQR
jgi:predicted branched-subunit amino acid permease